MTNLRQTNDQQQAAQRFSASQAPREAAALNGELGIDSQLLAMSEVYKLLKSEGKHEAAAIVRGRALAIDKTRKGTK